MATAEEHWRTEEADWIAHGLLSALGNLRRLDDTLAHYVREYHLMLQEANALAAALGEPASGDVYSVDPHSGSVRLHLLVEKVRALTGLPKLVQVDVEEQGV